MMLDHTVGVHDQVSWDAGDLFWRWSGRTPTAPAMPSSTRPLSTGSTRPPSPGGVLVRASSGRLELRVPDGVGPIRLRGFPTPLARASGPLCARQPTPRSVVQIDAWGHDYELAKASTPTAGVGFGSPDPAHAVMNGVHRLAKTPQTLSPQHVQGSIETSHLQSYLELHVLVQPPKLAQQRPCVDGSKGAATGPVTTADVAQGKGCGPHTKTPWQGELRVPLQQSGRS